MNTISLTPERQAQLADYAQRRGQDLAAALDEAVATVKAGRTRPADEAFTA